MTSIRRSSRIVKNNLNNHDVDSPLKIKGSVAKSSFSKMRNSKVIVINNSSEDEECQHSKFLTPRKKKSEIKNDDCSVSPSKQKKVQQNSPSPSTLLKQLEVSSNKRPIKPKRKSLFANDDNELNEIRRNSEEENYSKEVINGDIDDDVKVENDANLKKIYQEARKALKDTLPSDLPGREKELKELRVFIEKHLSEKSSASLYISGPPGTGKTASLHILLEEKSLAKRVNKVYVNCTTLKSPAAVYSRVIQELGITPNGKMEREYLSTIENFIKNNKRMTLLILDEIDQLETKNQSVLYTIFEWPSKLKSNIILIGIANALDLTDRILPRLQARCELKPSLMHFASYTKQQLVHIFTSRLKSAGVLEIFSPAAIEMLSGKVAAVSGDVRRALDIGRRVIELVEQSRKNDTLKCIENTATNILDDKEKKTVELKEVLNVLNNVYGTAQNLMAEDDNVDESFPLQQKIILCTLLLMLKKAKNKDITVGKLHEAYSKVCQTQHINAVDQSEFVGLCTLIETRGIIRVVGRKELRLRKVTLEWDEDEVTAAMKDKQLVSMILQDNRLEF